MSVERDILELSAEVAKRLSSHVGANLLAALQEAQEKLNTPLKSGIQISDELKEKLEAIKVVGQYFSDDEFLIQQEIRDTQNFVNAEWNASVISDAYPLADEGAVKFLSKAAVVLNSGDKYLTLSSYNAYYNRATGALPTPTGQESKLTLRQQEHVRTPEFISWFGDWISAAESGDYNGVSKLIDEDTKEPQLVFHGAAPNVPFFEFDMTRTFSPVTYVSNDYEYAAWYARNEKGRTDRKAQKSGQEYVYQLFCNMKNPLDFRMFKLTAFRGEEVADIINVFTGYKPTSIFAKNPHTGKIMDKAALIWYFRYNPELIKEVQERTNFDGIIFLGYNPAHTDPVTNLPIPEDEILVFRSNQLKFTQASFNSMFVNDIRFKKGGQI